MSLSFLHSFLSMGTVVTIEIVGHESTPEAREHRSASLARAVAWFDDIETRCSRFDPDSELNRLSRSAGRPVPVSELLHQALRFTLALAEETDGVFDPTVGRRMEQLGFNTNFRTGAVTESRHVPADAGSFRDVLIDTDEPTITLRRPVQLDLGAVAKGLAVDLAARELASLEDFAIDAGGDLYLSGLNPDGAPWSVGVRDPSTTERLVRSLKVTNAAVCTSGDYARGAARSGNSHHLVDARTGIAVAAVSSATVIAPSAMVADALATAAFLLGPVEGIRLLERHGLHGMLIASDSTQYLTRGFPGD